MTELGTPAPGPAVPDFLSSGTILPADDGGRSRRRTPWWVLAVVAAVVAALAGGLTYGVAALSGGGRQPADALPSGAAAFAGVDLDPPAGQKVDAVRFLRRFPAVRGHLGADGDLRKALWDTLAGPAGWSGVDYARDVQPWLGKRIGVAAYPLTGAQATGSPDVVVALQVGDDAKARAGLDRLVAAAGAGSAGYAMTDGYALLAPTRAAATAAAGRAADAALADDASFASDVADLGDGVATFWVDGARAASLAPLTGSSKVAGTVGGIAGATSKGRAAFGLRFDGADVLEVTGRVTGTGADLPKASSGTLAGLAGLPASTVAAVGVAGGQDLVAPLWTSLAAQQGDSLDQLVASARDQLGIALPADLRVLLGSQLVVALDRTGLGDGDLALGATVTTGDPARADRLVGRLLGAVPLPGASAPVHRKTADGYLVATDDTQADRLAATSGARLGSAAGFRRALPDLAGARFAVWVDLHAVSGSGLGVAGSSGKDLAPLSGLGVTAGVDGSVTQLRLRLVAR